MKTMKIALAQINSCVGAIEANTQKITDFIRQARSQHAALAVFPELAITGYPPEDLLLKPQFIADNLNALKKIVKSADGIAVYIGFVDQKKKELFNAGAFIVNQQIKAIYHKRNLPNYAVFDEKRYFTAGTKAAMVTHRGRKIGLGICEDLWAAKPPKGLDLILNINASPYSIGKIKERQKLLKMRSKEARAYIAYVNAVGGQDELVFDGASLIAGPQGKIIASAPQYKEGLFIFELNNQRQGIPFLEELAEIYAALVLGVRDYAAKNGFQAAAVGLSGGIDSALTLTIAADALGPNQVHAVFMPSEFTAQQSRVDAQKISQNLGIKLIDLPIKEIFESYLKGLAPVFAGKERDITEENLQARIRGNLLMALSNKFGWLVLTTGNKSEMSTGYCTLYGDTAGGFAVLKDVPKTLVYKLARWRNQKSKIIPTSTLKRAPTAELKPNQTDQDTLPPYETLDRMIKSYVEENKGLKQMLKMGAAEETARKVMTMIDRAEYKRRQAPPGPRISTRAFGKDWRVPITNHWKE